MAGGMNLATKYLKPIQERWEALSQISLVSSSRFVFKGGKTFVIYSIPYAPLVDYTRNGLARFGTPNDLSRNIQTLTVSQDKGFALILDKGDEVQSDYAVGPGKALDNEIRRVIVPTYDTYCYKIMVDSAIANGHTSMTEITSLNAHACLLAGIEHMNDRNVPMDGCVCYCTYHFANMLMLDQSFMRFGDRSQDMILRGELGMADGVKIVAVPASRLPSGSAFLLVHKDAVAAPRQIEEYRTHEDPPGLSGTLCEGRILFDCFVLDEHSDGIYYHGGQPVLKNLRFVTSASNKNKSTIIMNIEKEKATNRWFYITARNHESLPVPVYGEPLAMSTASDPWDTAIEIANKETEITPNANHTRILVVETLSTLLPIGYAEEKLNIG